MCTFSRTPGSCLGGQHAPNACSSYPGCVAAYAVSHKPINSKLVATASRDPLVATTATRHPDVASLSATEAGREATVVRRKRTHRTAHVGSMLPSSDDALHPVSSFQPVAAHGTTDAIASDAADGRNGRTSSSNTGRSSVDAITAGKLAGKHRINSRSHQTGQAAVLGSSSTSGQPQQRARRTRQLQHSIKHSSAAAAADDSSMDSSSVASSSSTRWQSQQDAVRQRLHTQDQQQQQQGQEPAADHKASGTQRSSGRISTSDASSPAASKWQHDSGGSSSRSSNSHHTQQNRSVDGSHSSQRQRRLRSADDTFTAARHRSDNSSSSGGSYQQRPRPARQPGDISGDHVGSAADRSAYYALQQLKLKTFEQLQDVAMKYGSRASLTNLMGMFSRLKTVTWHSNRDKIALLRHLWQLLEPQLQQAKPRHCAEAMLTASKLRAPMRELYVQCLAAFVRQKDAADSRVLSNIIYASATSVVRNDVELKATLERVVFPAFSSSPHTHPQAVSNAIYAAALLGISRNSLDVQQLLRGLPQGFWQTGTAQELSNTLWGTAELGQTLATQQLQQVLDVIIQKLPDCKPIHITNTLWGVAVMGQQLRPVQLQQLVTAMLHMPLYSRVIGSMLWSIGKLGAQLPQHQVDQFVDLLVADLTNAATLDNSSKSRTRSGSNGYPAATHISDSKVFSNPQAISNALHGIASMNCTVASRQVDQLLDVLVTELHDCNPQCLANTVWAIATMNGQISTRHLELIYSELAAKLKDAEPQAVSNAFWAASTLIPCYFPQQLMTEDAVGHIVHKLVPAMKPQELSNMAVACGHFAHLELTLMDAILQQITKVPANTSSTLMDTQTLCNICWACAMLDMRDHAAELQELAERCLPFWSKSGDVGVILQDKVQLYQLHMWLVERCGQQQGLLGRFSKQQLTECEQAWVHLIGSLSDSSVSHTQQTVYETVLQLPGLSNVQLEATTDDKLWSVDISADAADGRKLAIEVDGPFHYRRPDRKPTGPTQFKNRALAYRAYVLIAVPWWDWYQLMHQGMHEKVVYMRDRVHKALQG